MLAFARTLFPVATPRRAALDGALVGQTHPRLRDCVRRTQLVAVGGGSWRSGPRKSLEFSPSAGGSSPPFRTPRTRAFPQVLPQSYFLTTRGADAPSCPNVVPSHGVISAGLDV